MFPIKKSNPITAIKQREHLPNIPSISRIAPLPENASHGRLPVLSIDSRSGTNDTTSSESASIDRSIRHQLVE